MDKTVVMIDSRPPATCRTPLPDHSGRFRKRSAAADLLTVIASVSVAAALALFLAANGMSRFSTLAGALTSIGIILGLVGTDLVLIMLVLASRIPFIDRAMGHDRAMGYHRALGKPAFYFLIGHGVFLVAGAAVLAKINIVQEVIRMWALPDMPLAFASLGVFAVVIITSVVTVRKKFPYEFWHVIHLLSYIAVAFSLPHQFSESTIFITSFAQQVYWVALYVVALGSIFLFRFMSPIVRSVRHQMTVSEVEVIAPGVVSIHLQGKDLSQLNPRGGQFMMWRFWTATDWWHAHPISLSSVPTDTEARITVRALGKGSEALATIPPGTKVSFEGPYGLFTDAARTSPKLAIIAAGIGVTPVRSLLEHSVTVPKETTILLRASSMEETYLWDEMSELAQKKNATLYTMVGKRPSNKTTWLSGKDWNRGVTLTSTFPSLLESDLYICGPAAWADLVVADARAHGVPEHQIHMERFDW